MADTTRVVETIFKVVDSATAPLKNIGRATMNVGRGFDSLSAKVTKFAGIAATLGAGLSLVGQVRSAKEYISQIERVQTITNLSTRELTGMMEAMQQSGMAMNEVELSLISISKQQAQVRAGMGSIGKLAKGWGIDMKAGPVEMMVQLSDAVTKGKIGTGEVSKMLKAQGPVVVGLMDMLRRGPEEVQRAMQQGMERGKNITDQGILAFKRFDYASSKIKNTWQNITGTVMIKLYPALADLAEDFEQAIVGWIDKAARFGNFLAKHMQDAIGFARVFGKIMITNYLIMKTMGGIGGGPGGEKVGIIGLAGRAAGRAFRGGRGVIGGAMRAGAMAGGIRGAVMGGGGALSSILGSGGAGLGGALGMLKGFGVVAFQALRFLGPIGLAIMAVVGAFRFLKRDTSGIASGIRELLGSIWDRIKAIGQTFSDMFSGGSPLGEFMDFLGKGLALAFGGILVIVEKIVFFFQVVLKMFQLALQGKFVGPAEAARSIEQAEIARKNREKYERDQIQRVARGWQKALDSGKEFTQAERNRFEEFRRRAQAAGVDIGGLALPDAQPTVVQDFRGSRIEVKQEFAEGFDPGRIAVAFANDLATLGERRLQSGLSPLFTVR